jgi:hypothetical protein
MPPPCPPDEQPIDVEIAEKPCGVACCPADLLQRTVGAVAVADANRRFRRPPHTMVRVGAPRCDPNNSFAAQTTSLLRCLALTNPCSPLSEPLQYPDLNSAPAADDVELHQATEPRQLSHLSQ